MKTQVLNHSQILRICNRFAFQIIENSTWNLLDDTNDSSRKFNGFKDLSELAIGSRKQSL